MQKHFILTHSLVIGAGFISLLIKEHYPAIPANDL